MISFYSEKQEMKNARKKNSFRKTLKNIYDR